MGFTKYNIGLAIVILAFIFCLTNLYLLIFGIPAFIIGAILILFSNKPVSSKVLSIVIPLVVWFPLTLFLLYFLGNTMPETYVIPNNFHGNFRVIYGEKCGIEPAVVDGRRILEIPSEGILIIKPKFEAGTIDHEYYFVDSNGDRTKIPRLLRGVDDQNHKVGVRFEGNGNFSGRMPDGSYSSESPLAIYFIDHFVFNDDTMGQEDLRFENDFDSLTILYVDRCRQNK